MNKLILIICLFTFVTITKAQEDSIVVVVSRAYSTPIKWEDINFYKLENDGVWRARNKLGHVVAVAERKRVFTLSCFCKRWRMHGIEMHYNSDGSISMISIYEKGKWIRNVYNMRIYNEEREEYLNYYKSGVNDEK